jgi:hypothetical protein
MVRANMDNRRWSCNSSPDASCHDASRRPARSSACHLKCCHCSRDRDRELHSTIERSLHDQRPAAGRDAACHPRTRQARASGEQDYQRPTLSRKAHDSSAGTTSHPLPSNGTLAHAGQPSPAQPAMHASTRPLSVSRALSIMAQVIAASGTLARRSQHEVTWPARVPEFT